MINLYYNNNNCFQMQLSLPAENDNKKKLQVIQQQKKRLKDRIQKMNKTENGQQKQVELTYEQNMARLFQKKKKLEEEKQKQYNLKKMQQQYLQRKKQMERQKRLQQLQNEKRMIELQTGIKRMVFQGTKQKVKGMNSEQLMMRALLRDGRQQPKSKTYTSKGNVRRDFQKFLQAQHQAEFKEKWDIYELNQKRFEVFQKKQQTLMRQIVLKELIERGKDEQINVLKLKKKQLEDMLQAFGIDISDYMQAVPKQQIIEAMPQIAKLAKQRIEKHQALAERDKEQQERINRQKAKLKQFLLLRPADMVRTCRSIIYDIINDIVLDYEKRLNRYKIDQFQKVKGQLESRYHQVLLQSQDYQYSKVITVKLLQKIHEQFIQQAAQQMAKLHDFAHTKTQQCFEWMFSKGTNITKKLKDAGDVDIQLVFQDDAGNRVNQPFTKNDLKKDDYLKKFEDYQTNVFDVDKLTTQLINQINLLEVETKYFQNISIKMHSQKETPDGIFHILYDRQFYLITNEAVHNAKKIKVKLQKLGIDPKLQLLHWQKFHNFWLIHDTEKVSLYSPWGLEVLPNEIGERVGIQCGKIIITQIFPIFTILGQTCSIMLGFQKGQVMKYNMNLNRIKNTQTNLSFYRPILPQIKNGQQPPFPLQKKNMIKMENKKISQDVEIHQFRQFFEHHTTAVIGINFYKHNSFITVDRNLKCAIWYYDYKEGVKCYAPAYTFQFVCSYVVYKESDNPRFSNIYPGAKISESPQQVYQKWMQTQGFLRKQVYNNPKKTTAYFRTTDDKEQKGEVPLWKVSYDEAQSKVVKIHESYYTAFNGRMQAKCTKIWRQFLMILCEREHTIRDDLKTVKVYGWDIDERKMRSIGIQFDIYKNQTNTQFQILDNMLVGVELQLMAVVSSGRILIFSLISGQLLRNIADSQYLQQPKYASYYFTQITTKKSLLGAATKTNTMEISLNDHNSSSQQKQLNDLVEEVARKYINLL